MLKLDYFWAKERIQKASRVQGVKLYWGNKWLVTNLKPKVIFNLICQNEKTDEIELVNFAWLLLVFKNTAWFKSSATHQIFRKEWERVVRDMNKAVFYENQTLRQVDQNKLQPLPNDIHPNND